MEILRDKGKITKMLILLQILKGKKKLKEIAGEINITVQGVSEYLKILEEEGYVREGRITPSGWEFLNAAIEELGDFVHEANKIMERKKVIEAIAGERIEKGDKVGLFMEGGYLHAYKRESSSWGFAINSADTGENVGVKNLRGILDINLGEIEVFAMPPIEDGGSKLVDKARLKEIIKNDNKKVGVCGVVAYLSLKDICKIDFEFSAANAAIDAAYRGISTLLFVSHEMLPYVIHTISDRGIKYRVRDIRDL